MEANAKKKITVVVPFLNEEDNLPVLYDRLNRVMESRTEEL
jgi:glycosyltransferase involved in cell wall biosynthesis